MRAIWSFWSKPFAGERSSAWLSDEHHLLSWVLSLKTAARHYRPTALYTDDAGERLLVGELGLDFDEVHTSLNALDGEDPGWWATGKLFAYAAQTRPFVHIDSDVYLFRRLPRAVECAPVFAQNPEFFTPGASYYEPETAEAALRNRGGWLPPEWTWFRASRLPQRGENCGILGGKRTDFIRHYAEQALEFVGCSRNRGAWQRLAWKPHHAVLAEQYLLAACVDYHRRHEHSRYHGIDIAYLFDSMDDAFHSEKAVELGYTHLIATAKRNVDLLALLSARVASEWPECHERCGRVAGKASA